MAASLVLRTVKGTPLTNFEVDNNFSNLSTFANTVDSNIGVLSALTTTNQSNIVLAVNELVTSNTTTNSRITSITSANIRQFATGVSADLAAIISDETGTGNVVLSTGPTISLPLIENIKTGYSSTVTASGTTTLTSASNHMQIFTGSANQTVQLPVTSTLAVGMGYHIENNGTGTLTITSSGGNTVITVIPQTTVLVTCISTSGTDATSWDYDYHAFGGITGSGNVVLATSATLSSPTFVTPTLGAASGTSVSLTSALSAKNIIAEVAELTSYGTVKALMESANVVASAPGANVQIDLGTRAIQYFTSNAGNNTTVNFRANSTVSLNNMMTTGNVLTTAILITNGATPYYPTVYQVDGTAVVPKWQNGTAPSSGNASSTDIYTFTIVKTGAATFTVFGSQTKFA